MIRSPRTLGSSPFFLPFLAACLLVACEWGTNSVVGTDIPPPELKPDCPGHPSCKDGTAPQGVGTADVSGMVITASSQNVIISRDSKNWFEGSGGGFDNTITNQLSFLAAAGSPTVAALGACYTDPVDLASTDPGAVQRLIDRLNDGSQLRTFRFKVDKRDPDNLTGAVVNSWTDDGDGHGYRTWLVGDPVVTNPSTDVYVYAGGTIRSWDTSTNQSLFCPNLTGSVTLEIDR